MSDTRPRPPPKFPARRATLSLPSHFPSPSKNTNTSSSSQPIPPHHPQPAPSTKPQPKPISLPSFPALVSLFHRISNAAAPRLRTAFHQIRNTLPSATTLPSKLPAASSLTKRMKLSPRSLMFPLLALTTMLIPPLLLFAHTPSFLSSSGTQATHAQVESFSRHLSHQPSTIRAKELATALRQWQRGRGGSETGVVAAAGGCDERDAVEAVFMNSARNQREAGRYGVLDVGAGKGYVLTRRALRMGMGWVVAVEAVDGLYWGLKGLKGEGKRFHVVRGVCGDRGGVVGMRFREGEGCFDCVGGAAEEVEVYTIDGLMKRGKEEGVDGRDILVMRVKGYGKEGWAMKGARRLMESGRVKYLVIGVGREREEVLEAVRGALGAGLECWHLGLGAGSVFGETVGWRSAEMFWKFVNETGGSGGLFCGKRDR